MRTTIVIPTYNEAETLPELVSALFSLPLDLRILVVDDNSPDGTGAIAEQLGRQEPRLRVVHRARKEGLRSAYLDGFRLALEDGADGIAQMDADFSHDPAKLVEMASRLENCDLVIGSRYVQGGAVDEHWPLWRKGLSAFGNFYSRAILRLPQHDVTAGFRLWRRATLEGLPLQRVHSNGYVFQVEMTYLAYCLGYQIDEVPVYFPDRQTGKSKMSFAIQAEAALRVWIVWWNYRDLRHAGKSARNAPSQK
ncbi:MAG TPA: polyprenol monophosphomannose synthase [Anaerolineales bacterium]|nr:polyprenol monophosphomannose synthase [Anaerolineales bacterium]